MIILLMIGIYLFNNKNVQIIYNSKTLILSIITITITTAYAIISCLWSGLALNHIEILQDYYYSIPL